MFSSIVPFEKHSNNAIKNGGFGDGGDGFLFHFFR